MAVVDPHAFDFWIGDWAVHGPDGAQVGTNSVQPLFGTGVLSEHWRGSGGVEGRSLNGWDAERACWHQTWVDSSGTVLLLDGNVREDGAMVLEGIADDQRQRITWTQEGAAVRQYWESSADDGATWKTVFDGLYRRA